MSFFRLNQLLLASYFLTSVASAQWSPDQDVWRRARMMPMGQSQIGWTSGFNRVQEVLDSNGQALQLGAPFSKTLALQDIWTNQGVAPQRLEAYKAIARQESLNLQAQALQTDFDVNQEELRFNGHWAYGLSSSWMIGVRVPLMYRRTSVRTVTTRSAVLDQFSAKLAESHPDLADAFEAGLKDAALNQFQNMGYDPIQETSQDFLLGDTELLSKFRVYDGAVTQWALRQRLNLPTSSAYRPFQLIESQFGDGQISLGVDSLIDFQFSPGFFITQQLGYAFQFPDQRSVRVEDPAGSLMVDRGVRRNLGDVLSSSIFAEYHPSTRWSWLAGYSYLFKFEDQYRGEVASAEFYRDLSQGSEQEVHLGHVGFGYRVRNHQSSPLQANFYVSSILSGRGVPNTSLAQLDLLFYY